mmetsp:Transcript_27100/g.62167  ORF Transcript_27100/g.62167 Transcript_27100/m.62167 type:complete len:221 (-) Transcript_27100:1555-2217(-)
MRSTVHSLRNSSARSRGSARGNLRSRRGSSDWRRSSSASAASRASASSSQGSAPSSARRWSRRRSSRASRSFPTPRRCCARFSRRAPSRRKRCCPHRRAPERLRAPRRTICSPRGVSFTRRSHSERPRLQRPPRRRLRSQGWRSSTPTRRTASRLGSNDARSCFSSTPTLRRSLLLTSRRQWSWCPRRKLKAKHTPAAQTRFCARSTDLVASWNLVARRR